MNFNDFMYFTLTGKGLDGFFTKMFNNFQKWGGYLVAIIGVMLLIYAVFQLFKYFTSQQAQVSIGKTVIAFVIGGVLAGSGWAAIVGVSDIGKESIGDLGVGDGNKTTITMPSEGGTKTTTPTKPVPENP